MSYRQLAYESFLNAKNKLNNCSDNELCYVALDIRICIENLVYHRATMYKDVLQEIDLNITWNPKDIIEAMYEVDNSADQDLVLNFKLGDKKFTSNFKTISIHYLKNNYHALGSMLHAKKLNQTKHVNFSKWRSRLLGCIDYLDELFKAELTNIRL